MMCANSLTKMEIPAEHEITRHWHSADPIVVSVLCPAYNHARFIEDTLKGFLIQKTAFPFEIIIRDDGSDDGTADIIRAYAARYPTLIRPVLEPANTFQIGIRPAAVLFPLAKGKYIAHCDGDDYWQDEHKLQRQHDFLEAHPEYVLSFHQKVSADEEGMPLVDGSAPKRQYELSQWDIKRAIEVHNSTLFYRNVIQSFPLEFHRAVSGDRFLISLLGFHGKGVYLEGIRPSVYRVHEKSIWSMKSRLYQAHYASLTRMSMAAYYYRIGELELSRYFFEQTIKFQRAIHEVGWKRKLELQYPGLHVLARKFVSGIKRLTGQNRPC